MFRHITLPLVWPFIVVALVIRTIDALKAFDTIFVITGGGPGTSSETINILLYLQAFAYLRSGLRLGDRRGVLRAHHADHAWCCCKCGSGRPGDERGTALRRLARQGRRSISRSLVLISPALLVLPLDALALAQERDRQHGLSAGVHSRARRHSTNFIDVFAKNDFLTYTMNSVIVSFSADRPRPADRACRPATASPRRGRPAPRC